LSSSVASTVHVALAGEGVDVWRPVQALLLAGGVYRLAGEQPEGERWAFPPGAVVRCELRQLDGAECLVAVAAA
jgi:hypothetical protein